MQGLVGHGMNFRFHLKYNGNAWKTLDQRNAHSLRRHSVDGRLEG